MTQQIEHCQSPSSAQEIFGLENNEKTFARLLGFYYRYIEGPDIESLPDRSQEWIDAFLSGHDEADEIDSKNWDSAFEQGKRQSEHDAARQSGVRLTANR